MPETRPMTVIFAEAATNAGGTSVAWNQSLDLLTNYTNQRAGCAVDAAGICFGLSVAWLERVKAGTAANFLQEVSLWQGQNNLLDRARLIMYNQLKDSIWQKMTGLEAANDRHGIHKAHNYDLSNVTDDINDLAAWINGASNTRYFLLHVRQHTMAAVSLGRSQSIFFDPNGGIANLPSRAALTTFLRGYFSNEKVKNGYKGRHSGKPNSVNFHVEKFK